MGVKEGGGISLIGLMGLISQISQIEDFYYSDCFQRAMGLSMLRAWMPVEGRYFSG